jgi:hypothetical protein
LRSLCGPANLVESVTYSPSSRSLNGQPCKRQVEDYDLLRKAAIQMSLKTVVQDNIALRDEKASAVACLLVATAEDDSSIGIGMAVSRNRSTFYGLPKVHLLSVAVCG